MSEQENSGLGADVRCSVRGCDEPAVTTPRAPTAADVVPASPGEIVPLCAVHAAEAETPGTPAGP